MKYAVSPLSNEEHSGGSPIAVQRSFAPLSVNVQKL